MMDWILLVFVTFKFLVLGIGMFFAIKWHYDRGQKEKPTGTRTLLHSSGKIVIVFVVSLLVLGFLTLLLVQRFGLDITSP